MGLRHVQAANYHPVFVHREGGTVCVQWRNNAIVCLHMRLSTVRLALVWRTGPMAAAYVSLRGVVQTSINRSILFWESLYDRR